MKTRSTAHLRTITGTAAAVLVISVVMVLIPRPPDTNADTRTGPGAIGQKITYAWGRNVKYQKCLRHGELVPSGWGCLQWVTRNRLENCPGPGPGCSVINKYIHLTCNGYWVGSACRRSIPHQHPTTTTRPKPTTTTTRREQVTTTTRAVRVMPRRPVPTTTTTRPKPTTTTTRRVQVTTTTRPKPTTTTTTTRTLRPTRCHLPSPEDLKLVQGRLGWGTVLELSERVTRGVVGGDDIPVGEGKPQLFVTSNKLVSSAAAEPHLWPLAPRGINLMTSGGAENSPPTLDCQWQLRSVRSEWRELLVWRPADRAQIRAVAPDLVAQWERMGAARRAAVVARHRSSGVADPEDVECRVGQPEAIECRFFIPHPSVWQWKLWATFGTENGKPPQEHDTLVWQGVSRLQRLVDYTSSSSKICPGGDC